MRGRPDGFQLANGALVGALTGGVEREVVGAVTGGHSVDVGSYGHQGRHEVRAKCGGIRTDRGAERESQEIWLLVESVSEELEKRHRIVHHQVDGDVSVAPQRATTTALVPIDDGELLLQSENAFETPHFVDHG